MNRLINYGYLTEILAKIMVVTCFALSFMVCSDISSDPIVPDIINVQPIPNTLVSSVETICGIASWYSKESPGINEHTANGEEFDHYKIACASWDFPFGSLLEVTNIENGKKVIVRVNDRGPAKRLYKAGRVIDLTKAAFRAIANIDKGLIRVKIRIVK